jgi:hypothetical protein
MKLKTFMPVIIISQSLVCLLALRVMFPVRTATVRRLSSLHRHESNVSEAVELLRMHCSRINAMTRNGIADYVTSVIS